MLPRAEDLAIRFWVDARLPDSYPRNIEHAVALVLPCAIVKLPTLSTVELKFWLSRHRIDAGLGPGRVDLMGCLVAKRGHGILFVCGEDPSDEQRFTIAHETAHFLQHYLLPRERVVRALGESIIPVLDGDRKASPEERVAGVLSGVRVGAHVHLFPRQEPGEERLAVAEYDADDLGLELVAPRQAILVYLRTRHVETLPPTEQRQALASHFGVPANAFAPVVTDHGRHRPASFVSDAISTIRRLS